MELEKISELFFFMFKFAFLITVFELIYTIFYNVIILSYIFSMIFRIITNYKIFNKFNLDKKIYLVPIYSTYIKTKLFFNQSRVTNVLFTVLLTLPVINIIPRMVLGYKIGRKFNAEGLELIIGTLFPTIGSFIFAFSDKYQITVAAEL